MRPKATAVQAHDAGGTTRVSGRVSEHWRLRHIFRRKCPWFGQRALMSGALELALMLKEDHLRHSYPSFNDLCKISQALDAFK